MSRSESKFLGTGVYSIPEAARYTRQNARSLYHWFRNGGKELFKSDYVGSSIPDAISFLDLIEAFVVADFRRLDVSMPHIRRVHSLYTEYRETQHPFATSQFKVDLKTKRLIEILQGAGRTQHLVDALQQQSQMPQVILRDLQGVRYGKSGFAVGWDIEPGIAIDPDIRFGKPVISGTTLTTLVIANQYAAYERNADEVAEIYELSPNQVLAAVDFENSRGTVKSAA